MSKKKAAPLLQQQEPQGKESQSNAPKPIVQELPPDVKALRDLSKGRRIPLADMVEIVKKIYPRYDKSLHSRCAHGEKTGAMLRPDALHALLLRFAPDSVKKQSKPRRKRPNRCQCRLTDVVYGLVQKRLQQRNQTMQDYLEGLVLLDLTKTEVAG